MYTVNATKLKSVGLRVAAVAISILALAYSGDMIVLRCIRMYNKTHLVIQICVMKPSGIKPLSWCL